MPFLHLNPVQYLAHAAADNKSGMRIKGSGAAVNHGEAAALKIVDKAAGRIDGERGPRDDQHVSFGDGLYRALQGTFVEALFVEDDVRFHDASAAAVRHARAVEDEVEIVELMAFAAVIAQHGAVQLVHLSLIHI